MNKEKLIRYISNELNYGRDMDFKYQINGIPYKIKFLAPDMDKGINMPSIFAQRFALLHPEIVETACIGVASGSIPIPTEKLAYPIGVADYDAPLCLSISILIFSFFLLFSFLSFFF